MLDIIARVYYLSGTALFLIVFSIGPDELITFPLFYFVAAFIFSGLALIFVFHIDPIGLNFLFGPWILRRRHEPIRPDERILVSEGYASVILNSTNLLRNLNGVSWVLTDKRLLLKFPLSWPGLCLLEADIENVVGVEEVPLPSLLKVLPGKRFKIEIKNDSEVQLVTLMTRKPKSWLDAFREAGIAVT